MKLLFCGYSTIDYIDNSKYIGGAAGAMSINASNLEIESWLCSILSDDENGKYYKEILEKNNVNFSLSYIHAEHIPSCVIKNVHGLGSHREWNDNGANRYFEKIHCTQKMIEEFDGVIFANASPFLLQKFQAFQFKNAFYIPGPQIVKSPNYFNMSIFVKSQIVFCNEEESKIILDHDIGSQQIIVVTKGKEGGYVLTSEKRIEFKAHKVDSDIDPTGAGDAFSLGFITEILKLKNIHEAVKSGQLLSTKVIQKKGSVIDSRGV